MSPTRTKSGKNGERGRLQDKVVIVTGAAQGIGEAVATRFVREGAHVVATDVNTVAGAELAARLGPGARFAKLDVAEDADWTRIVNETIDRHGRIDGLVNNAAIYFEALIENTDLAALRRLLDVDLVGPWLGMKAVVPHMKTARRGSIVNISSVDGVIGYCGCTAYTAAKWGLRGITKSLAKELGPFNVRANILNPGAIDTPMLRQGMGRIPFETLFPEVAMNRPGYGDEIAAACSFLISDDSAYMTGSDFTVDGGLICGAYQMNKPAPEP